MPDEAIKIEADPKRMFQVEIGKEFHPSRGIFMKLPEGTKRRSIRGKILDKDGNEQAMLVMSIYFKPEGGGIEFVFAGHDNLAEQLQLDKDEQLKVAPKATFSQDELTLMMNLSLWLSRNKQKVYPEEYQ
jgi:hypothetical protein